MLATGNMDSEDTDVYCKSSKINARLPEKEERNIAAFCRAQWPDEESRALKVVVSYGDYAVKFGQISLEEAENQFMAHRMLNPEIVRVPTIYSYFSLGHTDYLVMECVTDG